MPPGASHDAGRVLDAVVQSRGLILDELAERSRFAREGDSSSAADRAAHAVRQRYANLVVRSLQEAVSPAVLDGARRRAEAAERELAERNAVVRAEAVRRDVGLAQVRAALPPASALVSFVRHDWPAPAAGAAVAAYAAFVVRAEGGDPVYVPLGGANDVDALVNRWRAEAGGQSLAQGATPALERRYRVAGTRLRVAVWDPLAPHLSGAARVFVVPDGSINLVSLASLPTEDGAYLLESAPILHYLTTERDLLQPRARGARHGAAGRRRRGLRSRRTRRRGVRGAARGLRVQPDVLSEPARRAGRSRRHRGDLASRWRADCDGPHRPRGGRSRGESRVRGTRVVHFATHGFFLDARCEPLPAGVRAVGGLTTASPSSASTPRPASATVRVDNPLLLSGLALAGANRRTAARQQRDDGILTAEEIAGLDLHGTEWAVLSACDTGLGEIRAGEGVFGLRRAFQIAGARTVIMSLWSVDDLATRAWMRRLYAARFQRGLDTASALRDASLSALAERRAKGLEHAPLLLGRVRRRGRLELIRQPPFARRVPTR